MVTVVPLTEFERLMFYKELQHSSNIDFIRNPELKIIIKKLLSEKTGFVNPHGFITVVLSDDTSSISSRILDRTNKFNQVLPRPNNPVYLHLNANTPGLSIDPDTLLELEDFDLNDSQTREFIHTFFDESKSGLRYFFIPTISILNVEEIYYDVSLEDHINAIRSSVQDHDLLYQPLSLF